MNLIVETDLGHDPDDLFAILYHIATGADIRLLLVTPGDLDQLAVAHFLVEELELDCVVCANKESTKLSSGGVHYDLLRKYGYRLERNATTAFYPNIEHTLRNYPDSEFFVIGPPKSTGGFFQNNFSYDVSRLTMQGGFLSYDLHDFPAKRLDKFEGKLSVPTFNMNGAVEQTKAIISSQRIAERQFTGKNVCHTIEFDRSRLANFARPNSPAAELFLEAARLYFNKHSSKKFHDPVAAVCHRHPEIGSWVRGTPFREKGGWGTYLDEAGDKVLATLDEARFWECIQSWT